MGVYFQFSSTLLYKNKLEFLDWDIRNNKK